MLYLKPVVRLFTTNSYHRPPNPASSKSVICSTTDFEDEFKPVKVRFARNLTDGLTIRLYPVTLEKLREEARATGMGPTTLVRMWVMEHLGQSQSQR
jgi:hypothetical protein